MTAKTSSERVQDFKQRQRAAGLKEVRNLWARSTDHEKIKAYVKRLTSKPLASMEK